MEKDNAANNQQNDDPIAQAFSHVRQEAKKRTGHVPDLTKQGAGKYPVANRPWASGAKKQQKPRRRGQPTGPDGRKLPRRDRMEGITSILRSEVEQRGWRKEIAGGWITAHWDSIVGEHIAAHTKVEMYKDKAVFITCDSTAWATNLRMMQRQILQSIAEQIGPDIVAELKIFGPKAPSWRHGALHVKGRGPRDTYG